MAKKGYTYWLSQNLLLKIYLTFLLKKSKGFSTLKIDYIYIYTLFLVETLCMLILGPMKQCKMECLLASNMADQHCNTARKILIGLLDN